MEGSLVAALLEAGLVTRTQLRAAGIEDGSSAQPSAKVVERLLDEGLDENALAGFFVSRGFGPVLGSEELSQADRQLLELFPAETALACCAMPLRNSTAGIVVAMANPDDEDSVRVIEDILCDAALPIVARLSDLQSALRKHYPQVATDSSYARPHAGRPMDTAPTSDTVAEPSAGQRPCKTAEPIGTLPPTQETLAPGTGTAAQVPSRSPAAVAKPSRPPGLSLSTLLEKPSPAWDRAFEAVPQTALTSLYAPSADESERANADLNRARARFAMAQSRDELVELACEASLKISRAAAFLALRKGVLRGWHAVGEDVDLASIQSLWVPASNPSILSEVVETSTAFRGPYGQTAADHLFRAALGGRGEQVAIAPVLIGDRLIGLLCADDPFGAPDAVAQIATDVGKALQRMIAAQKP